MKKIILIGLCILMVLLVGCSNDINKEDFENDLIKDYKEATANVLIKDYKDYIMENGDNLSAQLKQLKNGEISRVDDDLLMEKVEMAIDYLTSGLSMDEVMEFGFVEILWELYDVDDVLNPKGVDIYKIS